MILIGCWLLSKRCKTTIIGLGCSIVILFGYYERDFKASQAVALAVAVAIVVAIAVAFDQF